jgi:hypothetical protein
MQTAEVGAGRGCPAGARTCSRRADHRGGYPRRAEQLAAGETPTNLIVAVLTLAPRRIRFQWRRITGER